jgi:hypothetical protein
MLDQTCLWVFVVQDAKFRKLNQQNAKLNTLYIT